MKLAVMSVEKGEEIVAALISGHIPGTGYYKLLAKKKKDGLIEWAHFTERDNGQKENVFASWKKCRSSFTNIVVIISLS